MHVVIEKVIGRTGHRKVSGFTLGLWLRSIAHGFDQFSARWGRNIAMRLEAYGCRLGGIISLATSAMGGHSSLDAKFEFGLSSTIQLLVDGRIIGVKSDKRSCAIGITFEGDIIRDGNIQEVSKLDNQNQSMGRF